MDIKEIEELTNLSRQEIEKLRLTVWLNIRDFKNGMVLFLIFKVENNHLGKNKKLKNVDFYIHLVYNMYMEVKNEKYWNLKKIYWKK